MFKVRAYILATFFMLVCLESVAQYKKISSRSQIRRVERYSCPIVQQYDAIMGVGIKVGDPVGITYKLYFLERFAIEILGGYTTSGLYADFIRDQFAEDNPDYEYLGHENRFSPTGQFRILVHNPLPAGITGEAGVDWYIGGGIDVKTIKTEYTFETGSDPSDFMIDSTVETYVLVGPEAVLGFEYVIPNMPITAFAEGGVFFDLSGNLSGPQLQGGLGVRYNF